MISPFQQICTQCLSTVPIYCEAAFRLEAVYRLALLKMLDLQKPMVNACASMAKDVTFRKQR